MNIKRKLSALAGGLGIALAVPALAFAATTTVVVTPANTQGWQFNRDPLTSTPYEFNNDEASIGEGSLYVEPIGGVNRFDKFIAEYTLNTPASNLDSISYDFQIAGNGDPADANQFYLNVYTNLPGSDPNKFYDCRYDFVPTTGSTTGFTTFSIDENTVPVDAREGTGVPANSCPATIDDLPAGSVVRAIALNVGDTSLSDAGLAGYLDNVVIGLSGNETVYDFEPTNVPTNKDQCKKDGYKSMTDAEGNAFKNQGQCVSSVQSNRPATALPAGQF